MEIIKRNGTIKFREQIRIGSKKITSASLLNSSRKTQTTIQN
ncbi:MAG TPA: hypothetical protein VI754_17110 [Bacteriovoracaceae bacterium]|nr:hypothetical protein [Bacteriovoracaceae bacterium]